MADNQVDLKLNLDFQGVNDALYQMIGQFNGTDKEFQKIANNIQKNAKNLEAAIKLFGPASQQAGAAANKLQKDFQSLVANGIDPASASFKKMTASMPTSAGIDATTGSLRKNNIQWTNLALVIQDLPFGFRGIQNNLPAVAGGFAKMTGPIYLGISALIAVITAWDMGMFKAKKTTDDLKKSQEDLNKALSDSKNDYYANDLLLTNYVKIARDANSTDLQRKNAISEVNKVLKDYGIKLDENTIKTGKSEEAIKKVTEAMLNQALIAAYKDDYVQQAKLLDQEKELAGQAKNTAKTAETTSKKGVLGYAALSREIDVTALATKSYNNEAESQWLKQEQKVLDVASGVEKIKKKILELQKTAVAGLLPGTGGGKDKPEPKDSYAKDFLKALEEEQRLFKNNLDNQLSYAEGNDLKKVQLLQKAMADLVAWYNQGIIEESFYQNTIADLYKQTYNLKEDLLKKELDKEIQIGKLIIQNRENIADAIDRINQNMTSAEIKKIQDALKVRLRLDRNNINLQIKDYKDALKKLQEEKAKLELLGLPTQVAAVDKEIDEMNNKIESLGDTFQATAQGISGIISGFLADSFTTLGENIGNALSGGEVKPLEHFQKLLADALINIGKMLIQYGTLLQIAFASPDPFVAIAAGVGAVALGTIIKNRLKQSAVDPTAFANGGIVSGPTMGLMGEYPGAQNNPEVIAPLDKLKDLIGGGGNGQFVLRGQDLVLAMQRSNSSLNIRRG
jgi:exonuclease VII small subunit